MSNEDSKRRLEKTVATLQAKWGPRAIRRFGQQAVDPVPCITTGFTALDNALGSGGLPYGRITEIAGTPTSGMATLALKVIANAQLQGRIAVYIDFECTFDPSYATSCGVVPERLILVRPHTEQQGLLILQDFAIVGNVGILVCDIPLHLLNGPRLAQTFSVTLGHLLAPLSKSSCALLCLISLPSGNGNHSASGTYPQSNTLPQVASIRLMLQRQRWLYHRHDICGCQAQVLVVKNKLGLSGQKVNLHFNFDEIEKP